jgi:hypothetical protein
MRDVYFGADIPAYLDQTAVQLLGEARTAFHRFGLADVSVLEHGTDLIIFSLGRR